MKLDYSESVPSWLRLRGQEQINRRPRLGENVVHVTQLIQPTHQLILQDDHWEDLTQPVDDLIPAMVGTAWHKYLEGAMEGGHSELTIELVHAGWVIKGTPDWFSESRLIDFKTAKSWARIFGKREWEIQANVYRWMLFQSMGLVIDDLQIHAVYLDWMENAAKRTGGYPPKRWEVWHIEPWPMDDIRAWVEDRVEAIQDHHPKNICTAEERWERGECWAVKKPNRKTAVKLCDTEAEATRLAATHLGGYVEHRPGDPVRCRSWCSVREFCEHGRALDV